MRRRTGYNPKRRLAAAGELPHGQLERWAATARYGGKSDHKRDPGDFGLTPPASPRPGKTLCDEAGITKRADALGLLRDGLRRGVVSEQRRGGWPQNVWSVRGDVVFEAELENEAVGSYHGYPMQADDDFRQRVVGAWGNHAG